MKLLLTELKCDPNSSDYYNHYSMFSYCINNRKYQAMQLLFDECKGEIDWRKSNEKD